MEAFSKLGIDYHYMIIQLVNFGILFAALSYLLYKPILKMLDKRKTQIAESITKAERITVREQEMEKEYDHRMQQAQQEAGKIISEAKDFAAKEKVRLLKEAEKEALSVRDKAHAEIEQERALMQAGIRKNVAQLTAFVLTKVLQSSQSKDVLEKSIQQTIDELK